LRGVSIGYESGKEKVRGGGGKSCHHPVCFYKPMYMNKRERCGTRTAVVAQGNADSVFVPAAPRCRA